MPLRRSKSLFGTDKLNDGYMDPVSLRNSRITCADDDEEDEGQGFKEAFINFHINVNHPFYNIFVQNNKKRYGNRRK